MKPVFIRYPAACILFPGDELPGTAICLNFLGDTPCFFPAAIMLCFETKLLLILETDSQGRGLLPSSVLGDNSSCNRFSSNLDEGWVVKRSWGWGWGWKICGYIANFLDLRFWLGSRRKDNVNLGGGSSVERNGVTMTTTISSNTTALTSRHWVAFVVEPGLVESEAHWHCENELSELSDLRFGSK